MGERRNDGRRWFELPKDNILAWKPDSFDRNERGSVEETIMIEAVPVERDPRIAALQQR
jgi:hypothetical protein